MYSIGVHMSVCVYMYSIGVRMSVCVYMYSILLLLYEQMPS